MPQPGWKNEYQKRCTCTKLRTPVLIRFRFVRIEGVDVSSLHQDCAPGKGKLQPSVPHDTLWLVERSRLTGSLQKQGIRSTLGRDMAGPYSSLLPRARGLTISGSPGPPPPACVLPCVSVMQPAPRSTCARFFEPSTGRP